jgi:hypothetical protein
VFFDILSISIGGRSGLSIGIAAAGQNGTTLGVDLNESKQTHIVCRNTADCCAWYCFVQYTGCWSCKDSPDCCACILLTSSGPYILFLKEHCAPHGMAATLLIAYASGFVVWHSCREFSTKLIISMLLSVTILCVVASPFPTSDTSTRSVSTSSHALVSQARAKQGVTLLNRRCDLLDGGFESQN